MESGCPVDVLLVVDGAGAKKLAQWIAASQFVSTVYCVPSNSEINQIVGVECANVPVEDATALLSFALLRRVDVAVFGSKDLFTPQIGDAFRKAKVKILKPSEVLLLSEKGKFPARNFMSQ